MLIRRLVPRKLRRRYRCVRKGHGWVIAYDHAHTAHAGSTVRYCWRCGRVDPTWQQIDRSNRVGEAY